MDDMSKPKEFEVENESVATRVNDLNSFLDNYDQSVGLGKVYHDEKVQDYLTLTYEELNSYDSEECNIASYTLERYALYLQKEINRNQAKYNWALENIIKIIGKIGHNYGDQFTKYEMRRSMVINDNEYATALHKLAMEMNAKITELSYITKNISSISNTLKNLARNKYDPVRTN